MWELSETGRNLKTGKYQHFKGNFYLVLGVANHSETGDEFVVYQKLYGDHGLCVRPLKMFLETVDRDRKVQPRFRYVGEQ